MPKGDIAEDRPKISLFRKAGRMAPGAEGNNPLINFLLQASIICKFLIVGNFQKTLLTVAGNNVTLYAHKVFLKFNRYRECSVVGHRVPAHKRGDGARLRRANTQGCRITRMMMSLVIFLSLRAFGD